MRDWSPERDFLLPFVDVKGCQKVVDETCDAYGVTFAEMRGDGRCRRISRARWMAWRRLRKEHGLSTPQIGAMFDKDHTSVMNGLKQIEKQLSSNSSLSPYLPTRSAFRP